MTRPLLKFCGNRSYGDWCYVVDSMADVLGVIFAPSKRNVTKEQVKAWLETKPLPPTKRLAGIFVNESLETIKETCEEIPLQIIQCHGIETPADLKEIKKATGLVVWKAIHHDDTSLEYMRTFQSIADGYVVDTKSPKAWGGTGQSFDWASIPNYLKEAEIQGVPCFIAGGVKVENIKELLEFNPIGIDLASGIEVNEQKNKDLIQRIENEVDYYVNNNIS
ncbi:phosphoribosylanthranilate isomerase [Bacillus mesophilus]|uniref:N-(5'-phosphoribosyl)anthranilate isomerase n=1 Tax=Bacillus mesophilus TaxID=1808955 RepID=A0A6M0Q6Y9_9BACI|nr:phosphoribosylanthranilate isomerase [Bacillus mesophilus]MBM7661255.1 phosphoribosylanthranilate isomerase [Bacillus mesophilus]NEY71220.1 phosphoribosylanthranilate isomerase [Bacillus mesophilus]